MSEDTKSSNTGSAGVEYKTEIKGLRVPPPSGVLVQGGQKVPPPPPQARIPAVQSVGGNTQPATPAAPSPTGGQSPASSSPQGSTSD